MSNLRTNNARQKSHPSQRRLKVRIILWIGLIGAAAGLVLVGRAVLVTQELGAEARGRRSSPGAAATQNMHAERLPARPGDAAEPSSDEPLLVTDDGLALWVSPTEGAPLELAYLPPGVQIVVALRPAALMEHPEGVKLGAALGPLGRRSIDFIEHATQTLLQDIERLVIGLQSTSDGAWLPTLVMYASDSVVQQALAGWSGAADREFQGQPYRVEGERACFLPTAENGSVLVVAPTAALEEIIAMAGDPPPLRRDIERLLAHTDADRHVTLIAAPNSLFGPGRSIFADEMVGLREPLFWFLGDELSAAAVSFHWDSNFFAELLCVPTLDTSPERAMRILTERIRQVPDRLQKAQAGLQAQAYSRRVVARFPAMVGKLVDYTRSGFEPDHAVLRCYLPAVAGHNLLMGAELTLAELRGASGAAAQATAPPGTAPTAAESVHARLQRVTSLRFARDTLEAALEQLSQDVGVPIVIRGADLQAEGITKNQSFGIDLQNKQAAEILVEVLRLANPDKTATGPEDERQQLVYLVAGAEQGETEQIVVTTRAAAAERGEDLPAVFAEKHP